MAMDQPSSQYDDKKKAKVEVIMEFGQSTSNGRAAEATIKTFTNQSEHGSATASNWHRHHHHAQAYTSALGVKFMSEEFTSIVSALKRSSSVGVLRIKVR